MRREGIGGGGNPNGEGCCGAVVRVGNRNDEGGGRGGVIVIVIEVEKEGASEGVGERVPVIGCHHEQPMAAHRLLQSKSKSK